MHLPDLIDAVKPLFEAADRLQVQLTVCCISTYGNSPAIIELLCKGQNRGSHLLVNAMDFTGYTDEKFHTTRQPNSI